MTYTDQLALLDAIENFSVPIIQQNALKEIHYKNSLFWMIRTKKGYFYNEFLSKRFVALAWNNISQETDFSESNKDSLKDDILMTFKEIHRPSTVINKCHSFIYEIKTNDILVIPSAKSSYITFALAGEYYEDDSKTLELEQNVIYRIDNHDVDINDVSCPYKKRRHITLLRTVKNEELNYSLCRAISNYHGISNLDSYSKQILNALYNYYMFGNDMSFVLNVRKQTPIGPRSINNVLYGTTELLTSIASEECISTQVSLNSPGDIVFSLVNVKNLLVDNWQFIFAILVFLGGGSALSFKVPGAIDIVKSIFSAKDDYRIKHAEAEKAELEVLEKKADLLQKIKDSGINPESLKNPVDALLTGCTTLEVEPIILDDASAANVPLATEVQESPDIEDE